MNQFSYLNNPMQRPNLNNMRLELRILFI
uniref:Uncharacterized protein n=1 Tax=Rhizophora mucronata TaxID=61149 RepID=A0A2P2J476_RHIMU